MHLRWLVPALTIVSLACSGVEDAPGPLENHPEITARVEKAIERACRWLAKQQDRKGSLKGQYALAATSLAGLSWLASGSTPNSGPFANNITRALEFVVKCQGRRGFITEQRRYGPSGMYGHGYACQFLSQANGMVRGELGVKVDRALRKAVSCIEVTQNRFGGWNSSPNASATDDGSGAVAIMQITALRAAESCGVHVKSKIIERSKKYLLAMTNDAGWYAYNWHARGRTHGSAATTGAGMYMLGALNLQDNPKYKKGIKNLMNSCPFLKGGGSSRRHSWSSGWYQYTVFYTALAIYQHGGAEWYRWYPAMARDLILKQNREGNWNESFGGVFTGLATLSLALPYRYLPMFQEGGAGREGR